MQHTRTSVGTDTNRRALVTPSDIAKKDTKAIADEINRLVADTFGLYLKTKNFHWHVSGPHFRDYHLLLDEQAGQVYGAIDPLAERVRKLGQTTLRSVGHVAKLSRVKDNDKDFVSPYDMLNELLEDNKTLAANLRKAHEVCDEKGDIGTASLIENLVDEAERRVWFLFEATRGADAGGH